jgi:hypothetical protein
MYIPHIYYECKVRSLTKIGSASVKHSHGKVAEVNVDYTVKENSL